MKRCRKSQDLLPLVCCAGLCCVCWLLAFCCLPALLRLLGLEAASWLRLKMALLDCRDCEEADSATNWSLGSGNASCAAWLFGPSLSSKALSSAWSRAPAKCSASFMLGLGCWDLAPALTQMLCQPPIAVATIAQLAQAAAATRPCSQQVHCQAGLRQCTTGQMRPRGEHS